MGTSQFSLTIRENTAEDRGLGLILFFKLGNSFVITSAFRFLQCVSLYENAYLQFLSR